LAAVNSILQVENLTKSFGDLVLFENISFGLSEGQRVGLIAKNGSGKSTLLNILSGKEGYDGGTISFRRDIRVGYLEQDPQYPEELTVLEACFHHGNSTVELIKEYERCMETEGHPGLDEILVRMDHEKAWEYEQKAKQILSQLKIRDFNQQVKSLSGGQLKRVALANTLITEPDLLILDEPTNGLDPNQIMEVRNLIREIALDRTVLLSTHILSEVQATCRDIMMIECGHVVFSGSVDDFDNYIKPNTLFVCFERPPLEDELLTIEGIFKVQKINERNYRLWFSGGRDVAKDIVKCSVNKGWELEEIHFEKSSLDAVFAKLSNKEIRE